ncbi:uncharacterized protein K452DRAFT_321578 [Aplosporella prunicola CBS 121167]|uniref:Uncharacterized protein n=1 Tax=Aplosporella prunicola CBS 121167 TaxID=1176127 RepID=A0A6A6B3B4_9PEZI|nr:uncharacterized protein K452DRAFT_321578 [Aplosporella prunicola CBS 121167]KAF2137704.1 hypothetical protein K452DRAFT_321578 [Aplosporella prunicola CBS 121167]
MGKAESTPYNYSSSGGAPQHTPLDQIAMAERHEPRSHAQDNECPGTGTENGAQTRTQTQTQIQTALNAYDGSDFSSYVLIQRLLSEGILRPRGHRGEGSGRMACLHGDERVGYAGIPYVRPRSDAHANGNENDSESDKKDASEPRKEEFRDKGWERRVREARAREAAIEEEAKTYESESEGESEGNSGAVRKGAVCNSDGDESSTMSWDLNDSDSELETSPGFTPSEGTSTDAAVDTATAAQDEGSAPPAADDPAPALPSSESISQAARIAQLEAALSEARTAKRKDESASMQEAVAARLEAEVLRKELDSARGALVVLAELLGKAQAGAAATPTAEQGGQGPAVEQMAKRCEAAEKSAEEAKLKIARSDARKKRELRRARIEQRRQDFELWAQTWDDYRAEEAEWKEKLELRTSLTILYDVERYIDGERRLRQKMDALREKILESDYEDDEEESDNEEQERKDLCLFVAFVLFLMLGVVLVMS